MPGGSVVERVLSGAFSPGLIEVLKACERSLKLHTLSGAFSPGLIVAADVKLTHLPK